MINDARINDARINNRFGRQLVVSDFAGAARGLVEQGHYGTEDVKMEC